MCVAAFPSARHSAKFAIGERIEGVRADALPYLHDVEEQVKVHGKSAAYASPPARTLPKLGFEGSASFLRTAHREPELKPETLLDAQRDANSESEPDLETEAESESDAMSEAAHSESSSKESTDISDYEDGRPVEVASEILCDIISISSKTGEVLGNRAQALSSRAAQHAANLNAASAESTSLSASLHASSMLALPQDEARLLKACARDIDQITQTPPAAREECRLAIPTPSLNIATVLPHASDAMNGTNRTAPEPRRPSKVYAKNPRCLHTMANLLDLLQADDSATPSNCGVVHTNDCDSAHSATAHLVTQAHIGAAAPTEPTAMRLPTMHRKYNLDCGAADEEWPGAKLVNTMHSVITMAPDE